MKIRAQIGMVLNLDKCIGCHTCSVTCKNVWTSREGVEYAWFNNVETKPGIGYPRDWENQDKWNGGWVRLGDGKIKPKLGGKFRILSKIFANPDLPEIDDYYEPFTFEYERLQKSPEVKTVPTARMHSAITGEKMEKAEWGPNWEEILGGEFSKRSKDYNFKDIEKEIYGQFDNTFMMYLPRLCEHCLNPTCVASCPSGAIYKREEDGVVLIDQDKCRGWRMCVSGCPYKKIYFNWSSGKSEKCTLCYPRLEAGEPTVCSETCVGRIRYLGVLLYDADKIEAAASVADEEDLYQAQLDVFLDPNDPEVIRQAKTDGVPDSWMEAAQNSPVYKMAMDWKVAFPLHPEYRTLPMVWYIPPLSPVQSAMEPVEFALQRMMAMREYMREVTVEGSNNQAILDAVDLDKETIDDMYRIMALANYEDRFVIPTNHREYAGETPFDNDIAFETRSSCGFSFGNGCSGGQSRTNLFGASTHKNTMSGKTRSSS